MSDYVKEVPECFLPVEIHLRSDGDRCRNIYKNLSEYKLKEREILWLCREVDDQNNGIRFDQVITKKGLIRRYNLARCFFNKMFRTYLKNGHFKKRWPTICR